MEWHNLGVNYKKYHGYKRHRDKYKNTTKEQRAKELKQVICKRCKYHNEIKYVKKYGKCHLCGATLDVDYFKKTLLGLLNKEV